MKQLIHKPAFINAVIIAGLIYAIFFMATKAIH